MAIKVLVVEDDTNIAFSLNFLLLRKGYASTIAKDGEEAVNTAIKTCPQLILLDINLPKKSGLQVCQEILARQSPPPKIIFISAKINKREFAKSSVNGDYTFINKPFSNNEIINKITEVLNVQTPTIPSSIK